VKVPEFLGVDVLRDIANTPGWRIDLDANAKYQRAGIIAGRIAGTEHLVRGSRRTLALQPKAHMVHSNCTIGLGIPHPDPDRILFHVCLSNKFRPFTATPRLKHTAKDENHHSSRNSDLLVVPG
jgi:hypothetical protein